VDTGNPPFWKNVGYLVEMPYCYQEISIVNRIKDENCISGEEPGFPGSFTVINISLKTRYAGFLKFFYRFVQKTAFLSLIEKVIIYFVFCLVLLVVDTKKQSIYNRISIWCLFMIVRVCRVKSVS
jgi:hypothetical protein